METRNWLPAIDCPSDKMGGFPLSNATLLEEKTKNIPEHVFIDWTIHETTSPVSLFFSLSSIFFLFSTSLCGWQLRRRTAKRAESQDGSLRAHPINISGLLKWAAFNHRNHSGNRQFESLKNWMFDNNSNRCVGGSRCYGPSNMTSSAKSEEIYKY